MGTALSSTTDTQTDARAAGALRLVVHGLGRAGIEHAMAAARLPGCELAGFVEARPDRRRFARGVGFTAPSAAGLEALAATTAFDAVIVCVPLAERAAAVTTALGRRLPVLVTGVPAANETEAAAIEAAIAAGGRLSCGVPALFHPLFRRAQELFAARAIGRPARVRASTFVSRVFAAGADPRGGDVLDFVMADLLWLLDSLLGPTHAVRASVHRLFGERLDEVHATLELHEGLDAAVDGSWSVPGYPRAALVVEAEGERGSIIASDDALETQLTIPPAGYEAGESRRVLAEEADPLPFDAGDATPVVMAFRHALAGAPEPALDPARALRVVRVLEALRRSAAGEGVVGERVEVRP
ncbi:MAG: Gfo/Idh/MocA family oxidoreductase [Candidatus Eisenbacteria bacterium]|nr:Gfo/Idh/MocA family oxidoreductase [Candidatus Eisenbacteria bacterium]